MTLREFCQYLDLPPSEAVNHVFTLYDRVIKHLIVDYYKNLN